MSTSSTRLAHPVWACSTVRFKLGFVIQSPVGFPVICSWSCLWGGDVEVELCPALVLGCGLRQDRPRRVLCVVDGSCT